MWLCDHISHWKGQHRCVYRLETGSCKYELLVFLLYYSAVLRIQIIICAVVFALITVDEIKDLKRPLRSLTFFSFVIDTEAFSLNTKRCTLFTNHYRKHVIFGNLYPRIGSFCCVPLAFIFPVLCHLRLCQPRGMNLLLNVAVLLLGMALFVYTSLSALMQFGVR